jgi:hypothetical protein
MRSVSLRNVAVSGKSWTKKKDRSPKRIVAAPSSMKIHAHPGIPNFLLRLKIAAARRPPKDPLKAAAEKKMAWNCQHSLRKIS